MDFHPTFPKENDQNRPHTEPRALNLIAKAFLKALTSIFWLLKRVSHLYRPAESDKQTLFSQVLMDFHPTFSKENYQDHPNQEPRASNPILTSVFWLLKRVSYLYRPAESEQTDIIFARF